MMMDKTCRQFSEMLASKAPVPGGGGASAIAGALGTALGSMVGNLTLGKKKYISVQEDIGIILEKAEKLRDEFLELVEKDAEVFEPLSRAYGLPRETDEQIKKRTEVMEQALKDACSVPVKIMEKVYEAISLHEELADKGTRIAISDVGVGALFCRTALMGASLNVFINTKLMKDREYADDVNRWADRMLEEGVKRANAVYEKVEGGIRT
jgi:methenyltetrahydrofolate cyclohydrolase